MRGYELLPDASLNVNNVGLRVVKVRRIADLRAALSLISNGWDGYVVTRSINDNLHLGYQYHDGSSFDVVQEAYNFREEFRTRGLLNRWLGHIIANEPNHPEHIGGADGDPPGYHNGDCIAAANEYEGHFRDRTADIRNFINGTGIGDIPWTTPPLVPWFCEDQYIDAMIKATLSDGVRALKATDRYGNPVWRKYGSHHYWNNCDEVRFRYEHGMYKYAKTLYDFAPKQIIVDECNSVPSSHGGQYGGFGDAARLRDLKFFTKLTEGNVLYGTASKVVAIVPFIRAYPQTGSEWYNFDYTDSQWQDFATFSIYSFPDPC